MDASDIYILAFGGSTKQPTTKLKSFGPITEWTPPSELFAKGKTFLGTALLEAKALLEQRVKWYRDEGLLYNKPSDNLSRTRVLGDKAIFGFVIYDKCLC